MKGHAQKQNQLRQQAPPPGLTGSTAQPLATSQTVDSIRSLQRAIGNQAVRRVPLRANADLRAGLDTLATPRFDHDFSRIPVSSNASVGLQAKLAVNSPGDIYEQEADLVADQIMRMPASSPSAVAAWRQRMLRESDHKEAGRTQRAQGVSAATESKSSPAKETTVRALNSSGEPLHPALRSFFEPRFGHSFDQVRVHTDAEAATSAQQLNALAYTRGRDIAFAPGRFEPHTERGRRLLAHELTHVVQQGWAGRERIQRAYLAPTPDAIATRKVPRPAVVITDQEDEAPEIQRAPGPDPAAPPPAPVLASPTVTLNPGNMIVRGDSIAASVAFSPSAGEKLTVTDWRYTTGAGDIIARPKTEAKFQSEWKGVMALSGNLELSYTVKPTGKPAVAGTAVTSAVTVNDRTGPNWQTTITDLPETPLSGVLSPPEKAEELGLHDVLQGVEPAAGETPISNGPNAGFTFVNMVQDRDYKSEPHIHPDVVNAASAFRVFHRDAGLLFFTTNAGVRTRIPSTDYTGLKVGGGTIAFNVPDWTAFFKKYGVLSVTVSGGGKTVPAQNSWWALQPNVEAGALVITNAAAVRAALGISAKTLFTAAATNNGGWQAIALMPSANIPTATRSHEFTHATHSHRANFHKIVRALDPRRVLESSVSTPTNPVTFSSKIHGLLAEIRKPNHEIVDEAASKTAGSFVPVSGQTMAAINQDPASGASLGALWDLTHDQQLS